jgi:hypothetical protein
MFPLAAVRLAWWWRRIHVLLHNVAARTDITASLAIQKRLALYLTSYSVSGTTAAGCTWVPISALVQTAFADDCTVPRAVPLQLMRLRARLRCS